MSKRSQRSRSDRRAAAAAVRREAKTTGAHGTTPARAKEGGRKDFSLASLRHNRVALIVGAIALLLIVILVVWLVVGRGSAPAQTTATPEGVAGMKQWTSPPEMQIDVSKTYYATIKTDIGDIRLQLFADKAPKTVNNFVFLARQGYYDNTIFHRVIAGFMAQAGDPTGTGRGGPGYRFEDEFHPDLKHDSEGIVSMANAGANTNGSQFFITYAPQPHLDGAHTVFGKVVSGMDVARALQVRNPDDPNAPASKILTIEIEEQ